jgi:hypothetical protein
VQLLFPYAQLKTQLTKPTQNNINNLNSMSSPELLTPPKLAITKVARQILLYSPPPCVLALLPQGRDGGVASREQPIDHKFSPAPLPPRKSPMFVAQKVQVPLAGVKSTFNYASTFKHPKGQSVNIVGINPCRSSTPFRGACHLRSLP